MSEVDAALNDWDARKLSRQELLERLANLAYRDLAPAGMDRGDGGAPDFPQAGTLEEVQAAGLAGRLTERETELNVAEVVTMAAERRLVAEALTNDGRLREG